MSDAGTCPRCRVTYGRADFTTDGMGRLSEPVYHRCATVRPVVAEREAVPDLPPRVRVARVACVHCKRFLANDEKNVCARCKRQIRIRVAHGRCHWPGCESVPDGAEATLCLQHREQKAREGGRRSGAIRRGADGDAA